MTHISTILDFLQQIGIPVKESKLDDSTNLPGLMIDKGTLLYDLEKLNYSGDLLHEAGHIALMTPEERTVIVGNVKEYRLPTQDDEMGVMAWTFAASRYLNFPLNVVFHEGGYNGYASQLIQEYESGQNRGLPLLVWMGLCTYEGYPKMDKWLRE